MENLLASARAPPGNTPGLDRAREVGLVKGRLSVRNAVLIRFTLHPERTPMSYSTWIRAVLASSVQDLDSELQEALQPVWQPIVERITSFFAARGLPRRGLGV